MSTTVLQPEFEVHQMEFQKLLEDRRAVYVPKKLQDTGNEYEVRLTEAVLNNNVSEVESLLQNHMDEIDMYKGVRGLPPLFTAAMTNRTEICNLLLKLGLADPNKIASRWRTTPLRLAVKGGHIEVVKILLNAGASVDVSDSAGDADPLLHLALRNESSCSVEMVKLLLERHCDPNGRRAWNSDTPAHVAAKLGNLDILQALVERGAQLDVKNQHGVTPFYDTILKGNQQLAKWMILQGCNIHDADVYGVSPIRLAAIEHNFAAIRLLIEAGARLRDEGPEEGRNDGIVDLVADGKNPKIIELLLLEGARQRVLLHSLNLLQRVIVDEQPIAVVAQLLLSHPQHEVNPAYTRAFFMRHAHLYLLGRQSGMACLPAPTLKIVENQDCARLFRDVVNRPWKLKAACRVVIRRRLGFSCPHALALLPLPTTIRKYLQMEDMKWCSSCDQCGENLWDLPFALLVNQQQ